MNDKKTDYSKLNAEIARNWKRKKAELAGVETEKKHIEFCVNKEKIEMGHQAAEERLLDAKGRNVEKQRQKR